MVDCIKLILFLNNFLLIYCGFAKIIGTTSIQSRHFVYWPNATVAFFINPDHFDHEQSLAIMTTLSMFAFKTCLKFAPVMAPPQGNQHVLTFINPDGIRRCVVDVEGHSAFDPHYLIVGYDCLKSPHLEMLIMKALGFPFEHNRHSRDVFIEVLFENIESGSIDLFTKDIKLPRELQNLPYDYNSVMHFGDREYSKNGHRTIIFRDHRIVQDRITLSPIDLRKIEIVYGPECLKRDRQEKIDLCQQYPGVARRKREVSDINVIQENAETNEPDIYDQNRMRKKRDVNDLIIKDVINQEISKRKKRDTTDVDGSVKRNIEYKNLNFLGNKRNVQPESVDVNLRVNRNITPPPGNETNVTDTLKRLGIENGVMEIIEKVHKVSSLALKNARAKYCNDTKPDLRTGSESTVRNSTDILGIIESVANYAASMVDHALANVTVFCENSRSIDEYQRARCPFYNGHGRCRETYRSTYSGRVKYSTQHRPTYFSNTKHDSRGMVYQHHNLLRSSNDTDLPQTTTEVNKVTESIAKEKSLKKIEVAEKSKKEEKLTTKPENEGTEGKKEKRDKEEKLSSVDKKEITATEATELNHSTDIILVRRKRDVENNGNLTIDVKGELNVRDNLTNITVNFDANTTTVNDLINVTERTASEGIKTSVADVTKNVTSKVLVETRRMQIKERKHRNNLPIPANILSKMVSTLKSKPILRSKHEEVRSEESSSLESAEKHKKTPKKKERKEELIPKKERKEELIPKKERKAESIPKKESEVKRVRFEKKAKAREEMRVQRKPKTVPLTKANIEFYNERKWLDGVVRYIIKEDSTYDMDDLRDRIAEVNDILRKKTCVRLKEITEGSANKYDDYLVLDTSPDYVTGRVGGRQHFGSLELFRGNQHRQHTAMMVMAMLGFYFELSRHDRDKYVRVHMRHVRPDKLHHFEKIREEASFALPYDYESATHPAWQFWRKIGKTGISTVATYKDQDPDSSIMKSLGQHDNLLSDLDIVKINSVYGVKCFQKSENRHID